MKNRTILLLSTLVLLLVTVLMACGSKEEVSTDTGDKILPNPNKVYSDQCYVWLKEMPGFFRERQYFADGHAWDRHSYQGIYISDNPKSLFYSRHYVGETVLLFKPEEGDNMARKNIVYQYSISQGNDDNLDQIWLLGEFRPPSDCKQWVIAATGKHRGIKSEGVWHWHWPEGRNWEQPENPPGYDYPNAEEFNYEYPPETGGEPDMLGAEYWIETPPYGHDQTEPILGLPATEKPANTERVVDKGYFLVKKVPTLQQRQLIPPGNKGGDPEELTGFDHYNFSGVYVSGNPTSPFNKLPLTGKFLGLYTPEHGEDMNPGNLHCEFMSIQSGDPEGSQIWWWGESFPPKKPQLTLKVATDEFEGLSGIGTWFYDWPDGHPKPATLKGYDYAVPCEFTFDIPVK